MYLCYIDESGVPEIGHGTSHFVLVGLSIEAWDWKRQDRAVTEVKKRFGLSDAEVHTGWMTRRYMEQEKIANFNTLDWPQRSLQAQRERDKQLIRVAALKGPTKAQELRKTYRKTQAYIHLTLDERMNFLRELADLIGSWGNTRLFSEAIDKTSFGGIPPTIPPREEAFTQVVDRFERYLAGIGGQQTIGLLAHDHDDTSADRLTQLMRHFHAGGTMWNRITHIIETPFFVDSRLTVGVQLADLCAYAIRRFCENGESDLFDRIYPRAHRVGGHAVGIHYVRGKVCACTICANH
ncbi:MAG TPA: DUF3800 domain-containing protein [Terriglobia bacterium]|nr:DUF3800 domain-containing protein [Terriglobia bacterium]